MKDTHQGGPAFPVCDAARIHDLKGMTLRDYFAVKAMQIMWDAYDKGYCGENFDQDTFNNKLLAEGAYQLADAMLKAREA
jgi:hypothetical protein